ATKQGYPTSVCRCFRNTGTENEAVGQGFQLQWGPTTSPRKPEPCGLMTAAQVRVCSETICASQSQGRPPTIAWVRLAVMIRHDRKPEDTHSRRLQRGQCVKA